MRLIITMHLDSAAFAADSVDEIERILVDLVHRLPHPLDQTGRALNLNDRNSNHVGTAQIVRDA